MSGRGSEDIEDITRVYRPTGEFDKAVKATRFIKIMQEFGHHVTTNFRKVAVYVCEPRGGSTGSKGHR